MSLQYHGYHIIVLILLSCLSKECSRHSRETNASDVDRERSCHNATSSVTRADEAPVYDLLADVIKTTPNVVYGECMDGIETKPNEVYGVGRVSEL